MGKDSSIQWTDDTHNFWEGCIKVSEGCKYCYAERMFARFGKDFKSVRRIQAFDKPLKWKDPRLIFTCSTSDFFIEQADQWRDDAWDVIRNTPHHKWQILTKRPERILQCLPDDWGEGWDNVWIGVSVENQARADERIPMLLKVPCKVRFLSVEPMLGEVDLSRFIPDYSATTGKDAGLVYQGQIHWIIVGGESGNETGKWKYRPCEINWIQKVVRQAQNAFIPVFVKQLGTHLSKQHGLKDRKGGDINEWDKDFNINIREFPKEIKYRHFIVSYIAQDIKGILYPVTLKLSTDKMPTHKQFLAYFHSHLQNMVSCNLMGITEMNKEDFERFLSSEKPAERTGNVESYRLN